MNHLDTTAMTNSRNVLRITRPALLVNLPDLLELAEQACHRAGASEEEGLAVRLAVEEVAANIITHGYREGAPGPITLAIGWQPARLTIEITDHARPFAPDEAPPPDLHTGWQERAPGGLGWHLVRQMVDEIRYRFGDGNHLTLVKQLGR